MRTETQQAFASPPPHAGVGADDIRTGDKFIVTESLPGTGNARLLPVRALGRMPAMPSGGGTAFTAFFLKYEELRSEAALSVGFILTEGTRTPRRGELVELKAQDVYWGWELVSLP